jgi:RecJ-like exonuclease
MAKCTACNGSGYYDNTGSPRCGCCGGSGYTKRTFDDWYADYYGDRLKAEDPWKNIDDLRAAYEAGQESE